MSQVTTLVDALPCSAIPDQDVELLSDELPLIHRVGSDRDAALAEDLDQALRPGTGSNARRELGLDGRLFFWVGHCAYPETNLILIWDAGFEDDGDRSQAAPWDTGGLLTKRTLGRALEPEDAKRQIERFSLPPPAYRRYLAHVLARCYPHPGRYLSGETPQHYPGHVRRIVEANPPAHTFELRVQGEVDVAPSLIAIAYDPSALPHRPHEQLRRFARRRDVGLFDRRGRESMTRVAERAVRELLRERGIEP